MRDEVMRRAAVIEAMYGLDVTEALARWQHDEADQREERSSIWLSVAFLFGRRLRSLNIATTAPPRWR